MNEETKHALAELFHAYDAATAQQDASRTAAASLAAASEEERRRAMESVLRPALEEMLVEIQRAGHGAEITATDANEVALSFTPKHSIGSKTSTGALPKIAFTYFAKDRVIVSHVSGNGVTERGGPRVPAGELTQKKVEAAVLDLLRQVLPRGTYW